MSVPSPLTTPPVLADIPFIDGVPQADYIPPAYSPSVPPDYLIQSGGGLSNMHHGHPRGPYSKEAERSDIYGMSYPPQRGGFVNTVHGDMYDGTGFGAKTGMQSPPPPLEPKQPAYGDYETQSSVLQGPGPQVILNKTYKTNRNPHYGREGFKDSFGNELDEINLDDLAPSPNNSLGKTM